MHKCVHHQNHSPLKRKTLCYSDTNNGKDDEGKEEVNYSPIRKLNKELNNELANYDFINSNIGANCTNCIIFGNCKEQKKNNKYSSPRENYNNYLTVLISVENDIEKGKIELLKFDDFNYKDAFVIFDINYKCCLTFEDLKYRLEKLELYPVDNEIKLLFNRFDP